MLAIEATAVVPEGRVTYADVGQWDDAAEDVMRRVVDSLRHCSPMQIAIQLTHTGRKASTDLSWKGGAQISPDDANGRQTVPPSPLPFGGNDMAPVKLGSAGLVRIRNAFAEAARRAARLGLDAIKIHAAQGCLLHSFLSPLSNRRTDDYGGRLENRMRSPLEVFDAVRAAFPAE